jgi:hypothetical protein
MRLIVTEPWFVLLIMFSWLCNCQVADFSITYTSSHCQPLHYDIVPDFDNEI